MDNKLYVQITSGRGPVECCRVVTLVMREMEKWFEAHQLTMQLIEVEEGPECGTLYSAVVAVEGADETAIRKEWEGSILWVAESIYRPHHKRKNWFVGVKIFGMPKIEDCDTKGFVYETLRSAGPGGQHVNKTESAVRVTDTKTGLQVVAMDERSQQQNRKLATERLLLRLADIRNQQQKDLEQQNWNNHNMLQRGNPVKTFRSKL